MARGIGVTGGIASGKSTVLRMLGELGARTLSADDVARDVLRKDTPAYHETVARFSEEIVGPDGEIDRARLASIIFNDPAARRDLNDITHPRIISRIREYIDRFRADAASCDEILAVEIPLLIECGLESMVDEVLLVAAEQETQANRLTSRSNISREEAFRRITSQMPMDEKIRRADRVIRNDDDLDSLERSVRLMWEQILLP